MVSLETVLWKICGFLFYVEDLGRFLMISSVSLPAEL